MLPQLTLDRQLRARDAAKFVGLVFARARSCGASSARSPSRYSRADSCCISAAPPSPPRRKPPPTTRPRSHRVSKRRRIRCYALQGDADALGGADAPPNAPPPESLDLVQAQYKSGGASYVQVLTAEQSYQTAAIALVKARAQRYADTAALFQALGGGWWNRTDIDRQSRPLHLKDPREHHETRSNRARQARCPFTR